MDLLAPIGVLCADKGSGCADRCGISLNICSDATKPTINVFGEVIDDKLYIPIYKYFTILMHLQSERSLHAHHVFAHAHSGREIWGIASIKSTSLSLYLDKFHGKRGMVLWGKPWLLVIVVFPPARCVHWSLSISTSTAPALFRDSHIISKARRFTVKCQANFMLIFSNATGNKMRNLRVE